MIDRLFQDACGRVRDARNSQHLDAKLPRCNHFSNRGHADQIGANRPQVADLGWSFITGPKQSGIDAFGQINAQFLAGVQRGAAIVSAIRLSHVNEAWAETCIFRPNQRILALKINVI